MAAEKLVTFKDLGLIDELCEVCEAIGWKEPTQIQKEALPVAFKGTDIVGLAETGSGKTGAFSLPIIQSLLLDKEPHPYYGLILTPTRELAIQIKTQLDQLGKAFGLKCMAVVGGEDILEQGKKILQDPHIIVATLGRLADIIKNMEGFVHALADLKYLVMDEADRILSMDFEEELDIVIRALPQKRRTMLFSATITNKVKELQRAHLRKACLVQVNSAFKIVDSLQLYLLPVPLEHKNVYLVHLFRTLTQKSVIVFCNTRVNTLKTALLLRQCGHSAIPLYGAMTQDKRNEALNKFKEQTRSILVATDVASRGLDIPCVDYVILLEMPSKTEDFIHRVGRTARAGRPGVAITFVSQFEISDFKETEERIGRRMEVYPTDECDVMKCEEQAAQAENAARVELRRIETLRRRAAGDCGGSDDNDDTEDAQGVRRRLKGDSSQHKKRRQAPVVKTGPKKKKKRISSRR